MTILLDDASDLFMIYAESLTRSGEDDAIAETLLERLADTPTQDTHGLGDLITAKVYLTRILRRRRDGGMAKEQSASHLSSMTRSSRS